MNKEQQQADYLAKAKDAEEKAAKAPTAARRTEWLKIAEGYRRLAGPT